MGGGIDESTALLFHPGLGLSFRQQEQEEGLSSTTFPRLSPTSQSSSPSSSSSSASSSSSSVSYSSSLTLSFSANPHPTSKNSNHPSSPPTHTITRPLPLNTTASNNASYSGATASHLQQARELPSSSPPTQHPHLFILPSRSRSRSRDEEGTGVSVWDSPPASPPCARMQRDTGNITQLRKNKDRKSRKQQKHQIRLVQDQICYELGRNARKENDAMVYLDGPRIYTCGECRTHLTSHDEIISKSFHGRHGRAYLFDMCVNVNIGPAEDRRLITGLHSVSDIFCKRCSTLIGWTYAKAYEPSQKYKEGKFIIEKIHLFMEESERYQVNHPAGERRDKWKLRSMSWGRDVDYGDGNDSTVYEYRPRARTSSSLASLTSSSWGENASPLGPHLFHSSTY